MSKLLMLSTEKVNMTRLETNTKNAHIGNPLLRDRILWTIENTVKQGWGLIDAVAEWITKPPVMGRLGATLKGYKDTGLAEVRFAGSIIVDLQEVAEWHHLGWGEEPSLKQIEHYAVEMGIDLFEDRGVVASALNGKHICKMIPKPAVIDDIEYK